MFVGQMGDKRGKASFISKRKYYKYVKSETVKSRQQYKHIN